MYVWVLGNFGMLSNHSNRRIVTQGADISLAQPICNAMTFVFTLLMSKLLGEEDALNKRKLSQQVEQYSID